VSKRTRNTLLVIALVILVVGVIIGALIGHFATKSPSDNAKLTAEADRSISKKIINEIKPENIRNYLRCVRVRSRYKLAYVITVTLYIDFPLDNNLYCTVRVRTESQLVPAGICTNMQSCPRPFILIDN
jgi:hypothetical protein